MQDDTIMASKVSPEKIAEIVAEYLGYNIEDVRSKNRKDEYVLCRYVTFYLVKTVYYPKMTLKRIAKIFRDTMDHTTVMHGVKEIINNLETDQRDVPRIITELKIIIDRLNRKKTKSTVMSGLISDIIQLLKLAPGYILPEARTFGELAKKLQNERD